MRVIQRADAAVVLGYVLRLEEQRTSYTDEAPAICGVCSPILEE
jgi:hypothetical protein